MGSKEFRHANILELGELYKHPKWYIIVTELLWGDSLFKQIDNNQRRNTRFTENDAKVIIRDILETV